MADNTITGRAKKYDGTAIDYVSIFDWDDGKCVAQVVPDISGNWQYKYARNLQVGLTYVADGCEPITHGSYYFEFLNIDEYADNVVALLHFDGDLTDEIGGAWDSIGSPSITDTNRLFDKNILFSGNGGQQVTKTFVDALGTDDFTIEMFIRRTNHAGYRCVFDSRSNALNDGIAIYVSSELAGNVPSVWSGVEILKGVSQIPHSEWVHIAVCRKSNILYYFTGGILQNSANFTYNLTSKFARLGFAIQGLQPYGGHIDEFRITKGVARYTEDFIPPESPFPY